MVTPWAFRFGLRCESACASEGSSVNVARAHDPQRVQRPQRGFFARAYGVGDPYSNVHIPHNLKSNNPNYITLHLRDTISMPNEVPRHAL